MRLRPCMQRRYLGDGGEEEEEQEIKRQIQLGCQLPSLPGSPPLPRACESGGKEKLFKEHQGRDIICLPKDSRRGRTTLCGSISSPGPLRQTGAQVVTRTYLRGVDSPVALFLARGVPGELLPKVRLGDGQGQGQYSILQQPLRTPFPATVFVPNNVPFHTKFGKGSSAQETTPPNPRASLLQISRLVSLPRP